MVRLAMIKKKNLQTINAGEDVEKRVYTVSESINWCIHYGEQYGGSLRK